MIRLPGSRRERLLLAGVTVLLAIAVASRLPRGSHSGMTAELMELRAWFRQTERIDQQTEEIRAELNRTHDLARAAGRSGQNELRRYLESLAGGEADVRGSKRISEAALPGAEGWQVVVYELQIQGTWETLQAGLERIDQSDRLLKVDNLQVTRTSPDSPLLNLRLTVSALLLPDDQRQAM
jgi:hypothetical protein